MDDVLDGHVAAYNGQNLYDYDNNIQLNWYPRRVMGLMGNAKSILELGLGHGFTTALFSEHFERHLVLDASRAVIENFKNRFPYCRAEIIETHFEDFVTDEKFDLVVFGFILEHVDDPVEIMSYYKRFLAPQGKAFIAVPNAEVLNRRLGHIAGMLDDIQQLSDHDRLCGHKRYYTVKSLTEQVRKAGYEVERMEGIYLKPFTTEQMISLNFDRRVLDALCVVGVDYPELCCGILAQIREA
ncbi:class I SAM-dependent methyltransferase [Syntrophorhabdus aromaticivorans]|uniref:class I SAM-dependent methyltransferase n=1 Tax=Syntrophorhabdus aromaticivorans TaxID=328301 RepID=UPI000421B7CA|nr:class I SAM-dependent methyltransferase [Syntrophorhabdus aromaticivorans]HBA54163.1 class I SAM-dependent methyltransferase [Syntrophorhabdus aromaticivorans]